MFRQQGYKERLLKTFLISFQTTVNNVRHFHKKAIPAQTGREGGGFILSTKKSVSPACNIAVLNDVNAVVKSSGKGK